MPICSNLTTSRSPRRTAKRREHYFDWLGIELPDIPSLDLHEIVGEKIRAAAQRSRVRDLYDLYRLADQPFDRSLVRRIAVLKCWETNFAFDPIDFLDRISTSQYDWADLRRLVRKGWEIQFETIIRGVQKGYSFLRELTADEASPRWPFPAIEIAATRARSLPPQAENQSAKADFEIWLVQFQLPPPTNLMRATFQCLAA